MKILIASPTFDGRIEPEVVMAICKMCKDYQADFQAVYGYDVASARNKIVEISLNENYDYLLMIDSDTLPPNNALGLLLEGDYLIKAGTYIYSSNYDYTVTSREVDKNLKSSEICYDEHLLMTRNEVLALNGKTVKIGATGLGCTLFKTEVFKMLPKPYFKWVTYDNGAELGEDLYFAELCRINNIPICLDSRVLCGHIKSQILNI